MKHLIVNADDFGATSGVNRAIVDCHRGGVLTSASVMVTGRAAQEAAEIARRHPSLSVGLHWDVWGEDEREFDLSDDRAVREEFARQLDAFRALFGRDPTHVDSHRHAHREVFDLFRELVAPLGVPLREDGNVVYIGGFYAQWEWRVTNLEHVSVAALQRILREEVTDGWTEIACHPGYWSEDLGAVYGHEREAEVKTLTDPAIVSTIADCGIELTNYEGFATASRGV